MGIAGGLITSIPVRRRALVSLSMIPRDAAEALNACLRSAAEHFDEMIVVVTGSTDGTAEVARAHDTRTFDFVWINDFAGDCIAPPL